MKKTCNITKTPAHNEGGYVLVTALLIMVVLTIIGIAATTNTSLELQIAGNDKVHKNTFYGAEGAAILGAELLEQNISCPTGFTSSASADYPNYTDIERSNNYNFLVKNSALNYWRNGVPGTSDILTDANADIIFPLDYSTSSVPDTYLKIGGAASMLPGGSLQMAAGYEGAGKSAAGGGVARYYDIYARHEGINNSQAIIVVGWRHVIGNEETCNY